MIEFKCAWQKRGIHVQLRVFARHLPTETYALCGTLIMRVEEFEAFKHLVEMHYVQEDQ